MLAKIALKLDPEVATQLLQESNVQTCRRCRAEVVTNHYLRAGQSCALQEKFPLLELRTSGLTAPWLAGQCQGGAQNFSGFLET